MGLLSYSEFLKESDQFDPDSEKFINNGGMVDLTLGAGRVALIKMVKGPIEDDVNRIIVFNFHPNMGKIKWFELDQNSNFHTETSATEFFIFKQFLDYIDKAMNHPQFKPKAETLMGWKVFSNWFNGCKEKYKTKLLSSKYGL